MTVRTATGKSRTIFRLDEILSAAEDLSSHTIDVLAPEVVDAALSARAAVSDDGGS
ncbi:hypothetical protein ACFV3E_45760 [Streptomyces sp. NPDC059718]